MKKTIAIIGSGFGGLSLGIRLLARGFQVQIFEKQSSTGGHATQWQEDGYTFDLGPSLITAPKIIESIFAAAGERFEDHLDLIRLDPFYRLYFHDKSSIDYSSDSERMRSQLAAFHPDDEPAYDRFMEISKGIHDAVIKKGLGATPFDNWGIIAQFAPKALKLNALLPTYLNASRYFKDPRSRFTFSFHPLFIGGNPFRAPSIYQMIPYLEKEEGVWFTKGGMQTLVTALEELFRGLGGKIHCDTEVSRILVQNGRATGIKTNGSTHPADGVVSNADWMHTNRDLIDEVYRKKWRGTRLNNVRYSMGAFLLYLGITKRYPQLQHHTLILSERYRGLIRDIFEKKHLADDFSMYLHVPTKSDPDMAPEGCESMYVLVPVPNNSSGIEWNQIKESYGNKIIHFLEHDFGLENLSESIAVKRTFTPDDFKQQRNSYLGSAWGVEPRLTQTAIFRPHNRYEDIRNLYLVGASTHPGAGLPGVMLSAETTERVMLRDFS